MEETASQKLVREADGTTVALGLIPPGLV